MTPHGSVGSALQRPVESTTNNHTDQLVLFYAEPRSNVNRLFGDHTHWTRVGPRSRLDSSLMGKTPPADLAASPEGHAVPARVN